MKPRPYQVQAIAEIEREWQQVNRTLLVLPTGTGKTIVFSLLARDAVANGGRVLIIAHRDELIRQAAEKLYAATGLAAAVEKAEESAEGCMERVIVASVQTLLSEKRRDSIWRPTHIIVDEAHHAVSPSYMAVLEHWPDAKVLGVTATADRSDKKALGTFFESLAYEYHLPQAISEGYLAPIRALTLPTTVDLGKVGPPQNGDWSAQQCATALDPYIPTLSAQFAEHARDRKGLVFVPLRATGKKVRAALESAGLRSYYCDGEDRSQIPAYLADGNGSVIVNAMLLCLDLETEILTETGWVRHDTITYDHRVANWCEDGSVFFDYPKEIVVRDLYPNEHIVSIDSRTINLRVTNTHRMLVRRGLLRDKWTKVSADTLRHTHRLPSSGRAEPSKVLIEQDNRNVSKKRITRNAFHIRKLTGADSVASRLMAEEREIDRCALRRKQPHELSCDECRLIGFWVADGSASYPNRGGISYTLSQSPTYPNIIRWVDALLDRLRLSFRRKERTGPIPCIIWSLGRGTGGGSQKVNGLYHLEPYLKKNGCEAFRGLNEEQFDALVEGYWMGDGWHGQAERGFPRSIVFNDTKHAWIELLCTLGPVRGWRCAMFHMPSKNPKHNDQWRLRMIKGMESHFSSRTPIVHEPYATERVWCVKTTSKNIITRRHGKVIVMGNTEGWDHPPVSALAVWRFTKSRAFYAQMVGRGTRLSPDTGKENLLLLDNLFLCDTHQLCRPAHIMTDDDDVAEAMTDAAEKSATDGCDLDEAAVAEAKEQVQKDREAKLAAKLAEMRHKRQQLVDPLQYASSIGSDIINYEPTLPAERAPATEVQIEALSKAGIYPGEVSTAGHAAAILADLARRKAAGMAQPRQIRKLEQYGWKHAGQLTMVAASKIIGRIAANGWRLPEGMKPV